jgi:hypothetical protein
MGEAAQRKVRVGLRLETAEEGNLINVPLQKTFPLKRPIYIFIGLDFKI